MEESQYQKYMTSILDTTIEGLKRLRKDARISLELANELKNWKANSEKMDSRHGYVTPFEPIVQYLKEHGDSTNKIASSLEFTTRAMDSLDYSID
jgi:hypothetical protein